MTELKKADTKLVIKFCLSDFAKGIFTGMIANFLLTFLMPTNTSGITPLIHQGLILGFITFIGIIKALGHVLDAVTDPLIADMSDKCKSKNGRRMPFMRWTALPFGLSAFLIFCPPMAGIHWLNDVWVAFFIFAYFFFYTTFEIPHGALFPELITDHKTRLTAYTISSFCFVAGSALVYMTPLFVSIFGKSPNITTNQAYQITFAIFTVVGIILLYVTAFSFKEKEYVNSNIPSIKLFPALKSAFKNKQFTLVTVGQLFQIISMAFFQATIFYDIDVLLGLNGSQAAIVMGASIFGSVLLYPIVVKLSKKFGKKVPLISALIWFVAAYVLICLVGNIKGNKLVIGVLFGLFVAYPFAALNILPNAIMSDVIQYDTIKTGENKEGIFSAARSFITKLGQSIAIMFVPSLVQIGHTDTIKITATGLRVTALVSAFFCVVSVVVFLLYNNKSVISFLEQHKKSPQLAVDMVGGNSGGVDGGCVEIENTQGENMTEFNQKRYSQSLSDMVKIATVSHGDEERTDNIDAMQDYLRKHFKNVASQCEWRDFDGGLLIKWKGKDSAKKPLVLMSHMDVVSAGDGWDFEPFGGKIEDGKIFGRGTADTKGSLCAIFESVEKLIDDHFAPCSDIYILSSSREEVAGKDARLMAQYFVDNGICPSLLVDEGGAILDKPMAGVEGEYAMIAMSERSSAKLYLQGNAEAVAALEKKAVKAKLIKSVFPPEVEEMFRRLSKTMTQPMKFVFKNFNVFRGLLLKLLPKISAQAGAMVKPSVAFKPSDNEDYARSCTIASTFYADIDKVVASFEKLANKCSVSVTTQTVRKAPRPTDFDHDGIKLVERAVVESMPGVAPTPFIIFGGTDARHFVDVVDCVARFAPLKMNTEIVASVHNNNEYIFEDSVLGAVKFYCKLIQLFDNEDKE